MLGPANIDGPRSEVQARSSSRRRAGMRVAFPPDDSVIGVTNLVEIAAFRRRQCDWWPLIPSSSSLLRRVMGETLFVIYQVRWYFSCRWAYFILACWNSNYSSWWLWLLERSVSRLLPMWIHLSMHDVKEHNDTHLVVHVVLKLLQGCPPKRQQLDFDERRLRWRSASRDGAELFGTYSYSNFPGGYRDGKYGRLRLQRAITDFISSLVGSSDWSVFSTKASVRGDLRGCMGSSETRRLRLSRATAGEHHWWKLVLLLYRQPGVSKLKSHCGSRLPPNPRRISGVGHSIPSFVEPWLHMIFEDNNREALSQPIENYHSKVRIFKSSCPSSFSTVNDYQSSFFDVSIQHMTVYACNIHSHVYDTLPMWHPLFISLISSSRMHHTESLWYLRWRFAAVVCLLKIGIPILFRWSIREGWKQWSSRSECRHYCYRPLWARRSSIQVKTACRATPFPIISPDRICVDSSSFLKNISRVYKLPINTVSLLLTWLLSSRPLCPHYTQQRCFSNGQYW